MLPLITLGFNNLEKWDIIPTDFPKLVSLALSTYVHYVGWNKPLTELDMTGFDQLCELRACTVDLLLSLHLHHEAHFARAVQ